MLPEGLWTVKMPSLTSHLAGDLSFTVTHSSRFLPSKSMMASEGGAGNTAGPGVITLGTGSHCSVSSGFGLLTGLGSSAAIRGRRMMRRRALISFLGIGVSEMVIHGRSVGVEMAERNVR